MGKEINNDELIEELKGITGTIEVGSMFDKEDIYPIYSDEDWLEIIEKVRSHDKEVRSESAQKYLLINQWSMGGGQCPQCYGFNPAWNNYGINAPIQAVGHKPDCLLAAAMTDVGLDPVYID
jgi:hypothetical protein